MNDNKQILKLYVPGLDDIEIPATWRYLLAELRDMRVLSTFRWRLTTQYKSDFALDPRESALSVRSVLPGGWTVYPHILVGLALHDVELSTVITSGEKYSDAVRKLLPQRLRPRNGKRLDCRRSNWDFTGIRSPEPAPELELAVEPLEITELTPSSPAFPDDIPIDPTEVLNDIFKPLSRKEEPQ